MAEVRRLGPLGRPSRRPLGLVASAALALAATVLVMAFLGLPVWLETLGQSIESAVGTGGTLAQGLAAAITAAARGLGRTLHLVAAFRGLAAAAGPLLLATMVAALAAMAGVTSYVVGRDLRRTRSVSPWSLEAR
jgi:hypothetical protein